MKIRTAIFGTYVIASAVGLLVLMRFVLAEVRPRYVSSLQRTMQDSADLLAATLSTVPPAAWPGVYARIGENNGGLRLRVETADGALSYDSQPQVAAEEAASYAAKRYRSAKNDVSLFIDRQPFLDDGDLLAPAVVITADGRRLGRVLLSRPLRTVNAFIWSERKKLAGTAALVATVMLVLGWWLASKLTGSLERLARYAVDVRDGREARPPASRATEIAAVGEAFEGMRRTLEGKDYVEHFTHNLAHELKAPLTAIRGAAELLQEPGMDEADRAQFLGHLHAEAHRLHGMVDRMLRLSALEAKRGLEAVEVVDLAALGRMVCLTLEPVARARQVTLEPAGPAEGFSLTGERFLLEQAVTNLLQNALDFSPGGGVVTLTIARAGDAVQLEVLDQGPGVPDFAGAKVFERFYSLPRPGGGRKSTGLGLSFVREIAQLHGGSVGLDNRPGGGARAWLRLPIEGGHVQDA